MENIAENIIDTEPLAVSALAKQIQETVEGRFGNVSVQGEIGRIARPSSGHLYLDLKDDKAVLNAIIWKGQVSKLAHKPEEGLEVICRGRLTTYGAQSRYQLIIEDLVPAGKGALWALIEARRKKFAAEGLFDQARKKPLPFLPRRIGIITSPSGAVIRDILHRLEERFGLEVLLWAVQVQGEKCGGEVAAAIDGFNRLPKELTPDLLIVARGGGSLEDLQGFNEENVILAASRSAIPIISAIGHETDHTLLDLVADKRAPTPTAAAEISVPVRLELQEKLQTLMHRKTRALKTNINWKSERLTDNKTRLARSHEFIYRLEQRIDDLTRHLPKALKTHLELAHGKLNHLRLTPFIQNMMAHKSQTFRHVSRLLDAVSYQKVLERGFSLVLDENDHLVQKAGDSKVGQRLKIEFAHRQRIDVERVSPDKPARKQGSLFNE